MADRRGRVKALWRAIRGMAEAIVREGCTVCLKVDVDPKLVFFSRSEAVLAD